MQVKTLLVLLVVFFAASAIAVETTNEVAAAPAALVEEATAVAVEDEGEDESEVEDEAEEESEDEAEDEDEMDIEDEVEMESESELDVEAEMEASASNEVDAELATEISTGVWVGGCPKRACGPYASCVSDLKNPKASFTCECHVGFYKDDNGKCKEENKCLDGPCHKDADCASDGRGGFACLCKKGLVGDGLTGKLRYTGCKPKAEVEKAAKAAKEKAAARKLFETPEGLRPKKKDDDEDDDDE